VNQTVRVIKEHTTDFADPLILKTGDLLMAERKKTDWPGWIWCTDKNGKGGWIPECYLKIEGNTGRMLRDYDATELTARPGDKLNVLDEESGWLWCLTEQGRKGWIPKENVELI